MGDWLFVLMAVLVMPVVVLMGAAFVATSTLHRANRVLPGARGMTNPPVWWLWSPGLGAMLHRRLRSACVLAGPVADPQDRGRSGWRRRRSLPGDGISELAREVLQEAVLLDQQIVLSTRLARGLARAQV